MRSAGRHDPCPCGSGLRYRDCCLRHAPAGRPVFDSATRDVALSKLMAFAYQPAFDAEHSVAESVFWGELLRRGAPDHIERLLDADDIHVKYNSWFVFDWEIDGTTIADLFLEEPTAGLSDDEWHYLDALSRLHLRLYEVERVDRGRLVRLVDVWTGARVAVSERLVTTHQIVTWDLLGARVGPNGQGGHWFEGGVYVYPARMKAQLIGRFRRMYRRYQHRCAGGDDAAFFKKHSTLFHHLWLELVAFPQPPQVRTAEGDPLMFCRALFETAHLEEVQQAIGCRPEVRPGADGRLVLYDGPERAAREIGRWSVEGQRLVFETTSQARAGRGREWLEKVSGGLVQYRATGLETLEQTMGVLRTQTGRSLRAAPDADMRAVKALFDRHYRNWIDRPDPALGNRTPRAAARTKLWRPRLIEHLKRMENASARAALGGRPSYDFQWIWSELGLERTGRV